MVKKRTAKVWTIQKDILQNLFDTSNSYADVMRKLGMRVRGYNYDALKKRITEDNLSTEILFKNKKVSNFGVIGNPVKKKKEDIFVKCSTYNHGPSLIKRLIEDFGVEYKCVICENDGTWLGKPITLQLDHISGNHLDNRIENLRILCPNCHAQTDTYMGKNKKKKKGKRSRCGKCGKKISRGAVHCKKCYEQPRARRFETTKEELEKMIFEDCMTMVAIGKYFGVSDNSIRKRCNRMGINWRKK